MLGIRPLLTFSLSVLKLILFVFTEAICLSACSSTAAAILVAGVIFPSVLLLHLITDGAENAGGPAARGPSKRIVGVKELEHALTAPLCHPDFPFAMAESLCPASRSFLARPLPCVLGKSGLRSLVGPNLCLLFSSTSACSLDTGLSLLSS